MSSEARLVQNRVAHSEISDIEYQSINERIFFRSQSPSQPHPDSQRIVEAVLLPLNDFFINCENFDDKVGLYLFKGLLTSVREVEIMLIFDHITKFASRELHLRQWERYTQYCSKVASLCDKFTNSLSPNPYWRDRYYAEELEYMSATFTKSEQCRLYKFLVVNRPGCNHYDSSLSVPVDSFGISAPLVYESSWVGEANVMRILSPIASPLNSSVTPAHTYHEPPPKTGLELDGPMYIETPDRRLTAQVPSKFSGRMPYELSAQASDELPARPEEITHQITDSLPDQVSNQLARQAPHAISDYEISGSMYDGPPYVSSLAPPARSECDNCGCIISNSSMLRHKQTVCARKDKHCCLYPECEAKFPRPDYLRRHMTKEHGRVDSAAAQRDTQHDGRT